VETIGSKRSYALIWCMPNNDDDDIRQISKHSDSFGGSCQIISPVANFCHCHREISSLS